MFCFLKLLFLTKKGNKLNYLEFRNKLHYFPVFSTRDIRKLYPHFDSRRLVEWQEKGYVEKIINRWYFFSERVINEEFLFFAANNIYSPSYVSFETAMSYYQLIPEGVYAITSATSIKTNEFETGTGTFIYHHLKPSLFFGYHLVEAGDQRIKMAEVEKTILDYFYINENINTNEAFAGMRMNTDVLLSRLNVEKLNAYLKIYSNKALEKRVNGFIQYLKDA